MMIRIKSPKVLLVAPDRFSVEALSGNKEIRHITALKSVFPTIFEMKPNLVVFDYDYLEKDMEPVLRRMRANAFYDKVKICCYKAKSNTKTDGLLKTLGVNYIICKEDLEASIQKNTPLKNIITLLDQAFVSPVPAAAY